MGRSEHHIFLSTPMTAPLMSALARSLSTGRKALRRAGHGEPVLGPGASGGLHLDAAVFGSAEQGLERFFIGCGARARAFKEQLNGPVGRLVIPLAGYEAIYPHLWRDLAAAQSVAPFADLAPALADRQRGWIETISEIVAAFQPRELILLTGEVTLAEAAEALAPGAALDLAPVPVRNLPETGLAMLQRLYADGVTPPPRQIRRLMQFHARLPQAAPVAAFDPLVAVRLQRRFAHEIERFAAHPMVRIGAPPRLSVVAA